MFCYIYGMAKNQFTHESFNPALLMPVTIDNYWSHVNKTEGCWLWIGSKTLSGYGCFKSPYIPTRSAHRISYILAGKELSASDTLDHLCGTRNCVNPEHLDPCPIGENLRRSPNTRSAKRRAQTHCLNGHLLSGENVYSPRPNVRVCRICQRKRIADWQYEKRFDKEYRLKRNVQQAAAKRRRVACQKEMGPKIGVMETGQCSEIVTKQ